MTWRQPVRVSRYRPGFAVVHRSGLREAFGLPTLRARARLRPGPFHLCLGRRRGSAIA